LAVIVCLCNAISDRDIRRSLTDGQAASVADVYASAGCAPRCGRCVPMVRGMVHEHRNSCRPQRRTPELA
jgi:bacterioferritin-associated ferredoxin